MPDELYLKAFVTLLIIVIFILLVYYMFKKFGLNKTINSKSELIKLKERYNLDITRQIIILEYKGFEYVILASKNGEILLDKRGVE